MRNVLLINSSPMGSSSKTRQLTELFTALWQSKYPEDRLVNRDVGMNPPPHLDELTIDAFFTPPQSRTETMQQALVLSDELIDEVEAADILIIGTPMHNYTISSSLKTWVEHIVRAGRTFQFTEKGPQGFLKNKKVFLLSARGGNFLEGSPASLFNHHDTYLRDIFAFIGMTDIELISAEEVASNDEGFEDAKHRIRELV